MSFLTWIEGPCFGVLSVYLDLVYKGVESHLHKEKGQMDLRDWKEKGLKEKWMLPSN
jgi:hypothetical protein